MRTPNTGGDTRESGRKSSGKFLWPALGTVATALIIALSCNNGNNATKPHININEWNRDSVKTGWVNPSLKPGQGRWRGGKARMYKDDKGTHFVLTESEAGSPSSVDGTYYPEEIRELTITPDGDTTGKYTMNHRDLIFFSPEDNYITEAKAETLSKIKQLFSKTKTIPQYRYDEFNYEFGDLNNPKPRLSETDEEENGED